MMMRNIREESDRASGLSIVVASICLSFLAMNFRAYAQPAISVSDSLLKFGDIYRDKIVTRSVVIRNTGRSNLHIETVLSGCGCTTTKLSKTDIAPGDTGGLQIRLNTSILLGHFRKNLIIVSNDSAHSKAVIYYEANVINVISSAPSFLYMGDLERGVEHSGVLRLKNMSGRTLHFLNVRSNSGNLTFSHLPPELAPGDSVSLTVTTKIDDDGTHKDDIHIETDHPDQPVVRIGVAAKAKKGR